MNIQITDIPTLYQATLQVPEFDPHYPLERYYERLQGCPHLIQIAMINNQVAGFKAGYEVSEGIFYSWVGGVLPDFRQQGVAWELAKAQEAWLRHHGYHTLRMKTRNKFRNMLLFALKNGFRIYAVEAKSDQLEDYRILLQKQLSPLSGQLNT